MGGRDRGGISALCRLIESHKAEVIADLRSHYGVGLWDAPLRELYPLIQMLHRDPTSWLFTKLNDWDYPASRGELTLADMFDVFLRANSRKGANPKPYPRPFTPHKRYGGRGRTKPRTTAEIDAFFEARRLED